MPGPTTSRNIPQEEDHFQDPSNRIEILKHLKTSTCAIRGETECGSYAHFNYTIFGQLVSGQQTLTDLSKVAVTTNSSGEDSQPITPVVINSVALSSTNPNGVLHIDTTSARAGETATITVTATDPSDGTHVTQKLRRYRLRIQRTHRPGDQFQAVCQSHHGDDQ